MSLFRSTSQMMSECVFVLVCVCGSEQFIKQSSPLMSNCLERTRCVCVCIYSMYWFVCVYISVCVCVCVVANSSLSSHGSCCLKLYREHSICVCISVLVHGAVLLSLTVGGRVRAGGIHGDVGRADDDCSSPLLLSTAPPLLGTFDVLDGLYDGIQVLPGR